LPSVGPGNVLKDIIESGKITTITLNKIFRQAAKSKIIVNAHRVNDGEGFITKEEMEELNNMDEKDVEPAKEYVEEEAKIEKDNNFLNDFFFVNENSKDKILYNIITLSGERL